MILQDIKQKFRLVNAYEDWKDYRQMLTDMVIDLTRGDKVKTVALIGAGYCNDIDINRLCGQYKEIILADCDSEALDKVFHGLVEEDADKVILKPISITGITESDVSVFFTDTLTRLQGRGKYLTCNEFEDILMINLDRLLGKMYITEDEVMKVLPQADITVCNGVCSQLFSVISYFIRSVAASIPEALFKGAMDVADRAEQRLKSKNDMIIPAIVNAILNSAGDYVIFGNEYSKERPVEGAYQCIEAVAKSGHVIKECKATWSFNRNENIEYQMLLQVCKGSL